MTRTMKEIVEELEGPEKKVLVYDFDGPKGSGKFYEQPNEEGTDIYDDELVGGESGE